MQAQDVMSRHVVTCSPLNSVNHAAEMLVENGVSGMPVVDDDGRLVGIFSEGDLMRRSEIGSGFAAECDNGSDPDDIARLYVKSHGWNVEAVMTREVETVAPDTPLNRIAKLMMEHGFKRVPVMEGDRLVGIVSRADILRCITRDACRTSVPTTDEALALAVMTRIYVDLRLGPGDIDVTVREGRVTLSGTVTTETVRRAAHVAADCVPGVLSVVNELETIEIPMRAGADV